MTSPFHSSSRSLAFFCLCGLFAFSAACNREKSQTQSTASQSSAKRYALKGKVVSVDKNAGMANIDNEPITGFMDAMIMPYTFKPSAQIDQLQPGEYNCQVTVLDTNGQKAAFWQAPVMLVP